LFYRNFFRINPSAYLIYGFKESAFFSEQYPYDDKNAQEKFQAAVKGFQANPAYDDLMSSDRMVQVEE